MMGRITPENLKPHPKNPTIANFFKQLGWAEELGSGVQKMFKYCPIYVKGALPIIEEGDVFKLTIRYEKSENNNTKSYESNYESNYDKKVLLYCRVPRSRKEIMELLGISVQTKNFNKHIYPLIDKELLSMTLPDKPKSKQQKYITTEKGNIWLETL